MGKTVSAAHSGNGGIMGSGIFGMFGTTIVCKAEDNTTYCNFMKIFNILMIVGIIIFILYIAYSFFFSSKKR